MDIKFNTAPLPSQDIAAKFEALGNKVVEQAEKVIKPLKDYYKRETQTPEQTEWIKAVPDQMNEALGLVRLAKTTGISAKTWKETFDAQKPSEGSDIPVSVNGRHFLLQARDPTKVSGEKLRYKVSDLDIRREIGAGAEGTVYAHPRVDKTGKEIVTKASNTTEESTQKMKHEAEMARIAIGYAEKNGENKRGLPLRAGTADMPEEVGGGGTQLTSKLAKYGDGVDFRKKLTMGVGRSHKLQSCVTDLFNGALVMQKAQLVRIDLKLENTLATKKGMHLADLGAYRTEAEIRATPMEDLKKQGVPRTLQYCSHQTFINASPEDADTHDEYIDRLNRDANLALGVSCFRLITGKLPFPTTKLNMLNTNERSVIEKNKDFNEFAAKAPQAHALIVRLLQEPNTPITEADMKVLLEEEKNLSQTMSKREARLSEVAMGRIKTHIQRARYAIGDHKIKLSSSLRTHLSSIKLLSINLPSIKASTQ